MEGERSKTVTIMLHRYREENPCCGELFLALGKYAASPNRLIQQPSQTKERKHEYSGLRSLT
jgi:hypothetical protein